MFLQFQFQGFQRRFGGLDLFFSHLPHLSIAIAEHFLGCTQIIFSLTVILKTFNHCLQLGVFTGVIPELVLVGNNVRIAHQRRQLFVAVVEVIQFGYNRCFHSVGITLLIWLYLGSHLLPNPKMSAPNPAARYRHQRTIPATRRTGRGSVCWSRYSPETVTPVAAPGRFVTAAGLYPIRLRG